MADSASTERDPLTQKEHGTDVIVETENYGSTSEEHLQSIYRMEVAEFCCGKCKFLYRPFRTLALREIVFVIAAWITLGTMIIFSILRSIKQTNDNKPWSSELVMVLSEGFCLYYISHSIFFVCRFDMYIYLAVILLDVIYCTADYFLAETRGLYELLRLISDWSFGFGVPMFLAIYNMWCDWRANHDLRANLDHHADRGCRPKSSRPRPCELNDFQKLQLLHSLHVLDLHFAVCNVVFVTTDREVDFEEAFALIVGEPVNLAVFVLGYWAFSTKKIFGDYAIANRETTPQPVRPLDWKNGRKQRIGIFLFTSLGSFPFLFSIYKFAKQREGIRQGVYLDIVSLLFGMLSMAARIAVLFLSYQVLESFYRRNFKAVVEQPEGEPQPDYAMDVQEGRLLRASSEDHNSNGASVNATGMASTTAKMGT